jgi:AraC-like DNA-binding protein
MKTASASCKISFNHLTNLFQQECEDLSLLTPYNGKGFVQIFSLEKGLQTKFWDCSFNEGIEMFGDFGFPENMYFNLAFFLNTQGLRFSNRGQLYREQMVWDTVFISAQSNYRMFIPPNIRYRCLTISFSKKWLNNNVFEGREEFENLKEQIFSTNSFSLLRSMNLSEGNFLEELFNASWKKSFGSFYIKSAVLKIIVDFFYGIKEREIFIENNSNLNDSITEVEKYLSAHLILPLPNLKFLSSKYSISESTLKRHFKNRYGCNISTYFMRKKIQYAEQILNEENLSVSEAANLFGYRNVSHFAAMLKKYKSY